MKLDESLAKSIVWRTNKIIHLPVNVMNENGIIIASSNPTRIGQKHTGAILAIRENRIVEIDQELVKKWNFEVQTGINLPLSYLGQILGVIGISGEPEQVKPYAELVKMAAELILEQHILLEKERWDRRYKEEFILQLIKGEIPIAEIPQKAHLFQLDINQEYAVILIQLNQPNAEKLQLLVSHLEQVYQKIHLAVLSFDQIVLIKAKGFIENLLQKQQLTQLLPQSQKDLSLKNCKIAIGTYCSSIHLQHSYQTALNALEFGKKYFPKNGIYLFEQYKLPALLNSFANTWQMQLLFNAIDTLSQYDEKGILMKTLKQYFLENCDLIQSSKKLFIHVNTMRYRLAKIEQITGLSFNKIDESFILYLGSLLK